MRAFLLIALLALAFSALAQRSSTTGTQVVVQPPATPYTCNEPQSRFQHQADSLLQNLDKSQIPTGILYDRVAGMASLDIFNLSYNNADTSGINHFLQAYYEMHVGSYANTSNEPCRQVLRDNARYYQERGQVLIGALRYRFNYIDTNAVRNNQLRWSAGVNSQLLDVAGRNSSPYLLREVVVGAALIDTLRSSSSNFRLDPGSTFTNTGVALTSASIDFGNGSGAQTCTPGQIVQVSYSMAGRKVLRYTFTYADGSQFTTYSSAYVTQAACTSCRGLATLGADPCLTVPLTATVAYRGAPGEVDVSYYYRTANQNCPGVSSVRRPVVVIDGFDHNDIRNGPMIFNDYLSYRSINNNRENLGTELRNADYDVVIMNPKNLYTTVRIFNRDYQVITRHGGSDYIERNGLALVSLIQELNRQMQSISSTEQIVIVGPSMGGQIARYALSYMEANAMPHNTRLFVSLDSPHNGANIPIGLQHFVKYFADQTKDAQLVDALEQLDAPASRELTLSYYQQYYSQGPTFAQHPDRTTFMNAMLNFRPGGYPANLRRIAVTNGALNGARQRDQNGQVINDQDQAFFLEQKGTPDSGIPGLIVRALFPFFPSASLATRLITTASARVWYAPGNGQINRVVRTFKLDDGEHIFSERGAPSSCGLDGAPGGYRDFFREVSDGNNSSGLFQRRTFYSVRDKAVFIPMLSALGYTPTTYNNCTPVNAIDLVCAGTTPFDAYYGPLSANEPHIQLTAANVEFMRNEILMKTPPPVFTAAPNAICPNNVAATFTVKPDCPRLNPATNQPLFPTIYDWTLSGSAVFQGSSGSQTITGGGNSQNVVATASSGIVILTVVARRSGAAPSEPLVRYLTITRGTVMLEEDPAYNRAAADAKATQAGRSVPTTDYSCSRTVYLLATGYNAPPPYVVSVTTYRNTGPTTTSFTTNTAAFQFAMFDFDVDVTVSTTSACDGGAITSDILSLTGCAGRPAVVGPAAYPNPADAVLHLATPETAAAASGSRTAVLYNGQGREVRRAHPGETDLPTADLPTGLYYLMTEHNSRVTRSQVRVQH